MKHNSDKTTVSDEALLTNYKSTHSNEVLAKLYLRYTDLVYGVCLKYLNDEEDAKDAVMQIFEQLLAKMPSQQIRAFRPWLYVLVRNHCFMKIRGAKKNPTVPLEEHVMEIDPIWHPYEESAPLEMLMKCMEALTADQQQVIELFYYKERCYRDISEITGLEFNKVKSYLQNGKRNLKNCIDREQRNAL